VGEGDVPFDPSRPHVSRVYDYLLGGKNNFAADRAVGDQIPAIRAHLDWNQPIGLLLRGIVHYILDSDGPVGLVPALTAGLPPGSYVFIHHLLDTGDPAAARLQAQMLKGLGRVQFRTLAQVG